VSPAGPRKLFKGVTTATSGVLARFPLLLPVRNSFASYGASAVTRTSQCKACTNASEVMCASVQLRQPCRPFSDAVCVQCPEVNKGSYIANEMFEDDCISKCKPGHYNDTSRHQEGRCLRCWDRNELLRDASLQRAQFVYFKNCTDTANARWHACPEEEGSTLVGSDPGFTGHCLRECQLGWHRDRTV
jgi:hypothetical protein